MNSQIWDYCLLTVTWYDRQFIIRTIRHSSNSTPQIEDTKTGIGGESHGNVSFNQYLAYAQALVKLGAEGWEVASAIQGPPASTMLVLKRPAQRT